MAGTMIKIVNACEKPARIRSAIIGGIGNHDEETVVKEINHLLKKGNHVFVQDSLHHLFTWLVMNLVKP